LYCSHNKAIYLENLVKPSETPRPLALTGITAHTQEHFTSSDKTQQKKKIIQVYQYLTKLLSKVNGQLLLYSNGLSASH